MRRQETNTPLQALTLLNDQAFVEQAEAFANRIATAPVGSDTERLEFAFRTCVGRRPGANEAAVLERLMAPSGDDATAPNPKRWLMVARALLNLDEFITRE